MKLQTALTGTSGSNALSTVHRPRHSDIYFGTVIISLASGSGTAKLQVSADGGTTKVDMKDVSGNAISTTGSAMFNFKLGNGAKSDDAPIIYATLTGGTSANFTVTLFDNR